MISSSSSHQGQATSNRPTSTPPPACESSSRGAQATTSHYRPTRGTKKPPPHTGQGFHGGSIYAASLCTSSCSVSDNCRNMFSRSSLLVITAIGLLCFNTFAITGIRSRITQRNNIKLSPVSSAFFRTTPKKSCGKSSVGSTRSGKTRLLESLLSLRCSTSPLVVAS